MKYYKIIVSLTPNDEMASDILQAQMGERGFESFVATANGFEGYIQQELWDDATTMDGIDPMIKNVQFKWTKEDAPDEDWNAEWEKNFFSPIDIDGRCTIRSTFHEPNPNAEHEVLINPQMAFGTGHHETTRLMVRWILDNVKSGKNVLDMGCGTGVLGILAKMRGAARVVGIDIDEWSTKNAEDNILLNNVKDMEIRLGGAEQTNDLKGEMDIVLANINRNILMRDMENYVKALRPNGTLVLSGFYDIDCSNIAARCAELGMRETSREELNKWTRMVFTF